MPEAFERVSKRKECAICHRTTGACAEMVLYHLCMRMESSMPAKLGWLHPKAMDHDKPLPAIPKNKPRKSSRELNAHWKPIIDASVMRALPILCRLATELGVSQRFLAELEVGWSDMYGGSWLFPEKNARGLYRGATCRLTRPMQDGRTKLCGKGGSHGLFYRRHWTQGSAQYTYCAEGGSDTAALLTMGLRAIGRPSNLGGVSDIAKLIRPFPELIPVVVGENDRKEKLYLDQLTPIHNPKCRCCARCWPGGYGARETAKRLSEKLGRQVRVIFPPAGYKDVRLWFQSTRIDPENVKDCLDAGRLWAKLTGTK